MACIPKNLSLGCAPAVLRRIKMKKNILIAMLIALSLLLIAGCAVNKAPAIEEDEGKEENPPVITPETISEEEQKALDSYLSAFGHVRVLGDIDHILKGEKVDDEQGVTVQSMVAGEISFDINRTELAIPLTLTKYDFDGHRNPEDPDKHLYTRTATGTATLVLTGAVTAEGTSFIATGYRVENADITLSVDDSVYIYLQLPDLEVEAEKLEGIFTTAGGVARASVTVLIDGGKPSGIADVNTPKFGGIDGEITVNGKIGAVI